MNMRKKQKKNKNVNINQTSFYFEDCWRQIKRIEIKKIFFKIEFILFFFFFINFNF